MNFVKLTDVSVDNIRPIYINLDNVISIERNEEDMATHLGIFGVDKYALYIYIVKETPEEILKEGRRFQ